MTPAQLTRVLQSLEDVRDVAGANAQLAGHVAVLTCAVGALVQTHPDPAAFAQAMRQACAAGALACTKPGAQSSIPTQSELDTFLQTFAIQ